MDETYRAIILILVGWGVGIISTLINDALQSRREKLKNRLEREKEIRLRLVGDLIQTSEVMSFIESARRRKEQPDLSRANLKAVDLRDQNLQGIKLYRATLDEADLDGSLLNGSDLSKASLVKTKLYGAKMGMVHFLDK
jgi:uncharacterized protein YjbI with pentapeptide repeats